MGLSPRPIVFRGGTLVLNCATSAAGSIRVEVQDAGGAALPGLSAADCVPIFGDDLERPVRWGGGAGGSLAPLAGRPVRLRFILEDAGVFAFRFR